MNSYLIGALTLCLAAQCAVAQYQSAAGGYNQRKMAPSPQQYGNQQNSYMPQQQSYGQQQQSYGQEQAYEQQSYEPQQQMSYRAPSSAAVSSYDDRTPAASSYAAKSSGYGKQQSGYGQQQSGYGQQSNYGQQQQASYAAPKAAKYEEPYYPPQPFAWGYDINDGYGGAQYHKETGDDYGKRTGSYGYTDAYGIYRQVDYVADENGFRATIKTNEPGTSNESPADVELHAYEPPSNYYAGNTGSSYGASAKSSYGASGYGAQGGNAYAAPAAAAAYSAPKQQMSYGSGQRYNTKSQGGYGQQAARGGYGEQAAQYSSSVIVPVYQKAAPVAKPVAVAAKRY